MGWMPDDEFRREMAEAGATIRLSMQDEREREPCADNPRHYYGSPCKRCGGTRRYTSSQTCVNCARAAAKAQTSEQQRVRSGLPRTPEKPAVDPLIASMPDLSTFKLGDKWVPPRAPKPKPLGRRDPRITAANLTQDD